MQAAIDRMAVHAAVQAAAVQDDDQASESELKAQLA